MKRAVPGHPRQVRQADFAVEVAIHVLANFVYYVGRASGQRLLGMAAPARPESGALSRCSFSEEEYVLRLWPPRRT